MFRKIEEYLSRWDRIDAPGLALAVVEDGETIFQRSYGLANLDSKDPINSRTVFRVASLAKQFTGACICLLEDKGALTLEDDVHWWVPELPRYESPVTLGHLLWHTSGIIDFPHLLWGLSGHSFGDAVREQGVLDMLARIDRTDFKPGTQHFYCNSGYFLLGLVVARISGQSLADFANDRIFAPLGMKNTHFHDDYTRVIANRAVGYTPRQEGWAVMDAPTCTLVGDDGLFTTLEDMLIWERNFYEDKLGIVQRMLKEGRLESGREVKYGCGLFLDEPRGQERFWHYGEFLGFQSVFRSYPRQKLSIICLANTSELAPIDFADKLEDILISEQYQAFSAEQNASKPPFLGLVNFNKFTGRFCNRVEGFTIETKIGNGLQMVINGMTTLDLVMTAENKFEVPDLDYCLGLEFDPHRKTALFIDGDLVFHLEPLTGPVQSPTPQDLALLAGEYYSAWLDTTWVVKAEGNNLLLVNKDRHRISPGEPLTHVFEDFYVAWFGLWRRKIRFERPAAMVVLNGDSSPVRFEKI